MDEKSKNLEIIARTIANRSKKQRHYFDDYDDVSPSRRVKGLWTYGRETYGLQRIFVYVPAQSEIPLKELSNLLSRVDGKLERAGSFKRILCTYGYGNEGRHGQGAFLQGHFSIGADQWLAALTLLTEQGETPRPITFNTFRVPYRHAFGTEASTTPTVNDPVLIIAPHKEVLATEKAEKGVFALRRNLSWVIHGAGGWTVVTSALWLAANGDK